MSGQTVARRMILSVGFSSFLTFAVTALGDVLTVPQGVGTSLTASASYDNIVVHGPLTVSGSGVAVLATNWVLSAIGPDAGDNASVTVSDGAYLKVLEDVTYGANGGRGGTIRVSGDAEMAKENWTKRAGDDLLGTFGGHVVHTVSANLTSDTGMFDLAELGDQGYLGIKQIATENTSVKTRILFGGGKIWSKNANSVTFFNAVEGSEIILEGVGDNYIDIAKLYGPTVTFKTGAGTLRVRGKGALRYKVINSPEETTTMLGAGVAWENDGGFVIAGGDNVVRVTYDNVLPYAKGGVTILGGRGSWDASKPSCCNILDLNGTKQKICDLKLENFAYVTNSSATRATLEIGECATSSLSLSGVIGGAVDVVVKSGPSVAHAANFTLVNGATLRMVKTDEVLQNAKTDGGDFAGTVTVSNWCQNVSSDATHVKSGAARDLPVSLVRQMNLTGGALDIRGGALCVARFSGTEDSSLHIRSNTAFRAQAQEARSCTFLRLVLKEAIGLSAYPNLKIYPNLRTFNLVDENGENYWPGAEGFTMQPAGTAPGDLPEGSYTFHSDKYANGEGPELDTVNVPNAWPESDLRSSDYVFGPERLFMSYAQNWGNLLFTNSVPIRTDESSWHVVTIRLKETGPKLTGYCLQSNWNVRHYPGCWAVETSTDGVNWVTLDEKTDYYPFSYSNNNGSSEGYSKWNYSKSPAEIQFPFLWTRNVTPGEATFALNGAKLRVDRGAVLDVSQTGAPAEVAWLEVDAAAGAGAISSFRPAPNGVLNLVNVKTPGTLSPAERRISLTCGAIVDPENLATWKVRADGVPVDGATVERAEDGLKVRVTGLTFLIR